MSEVGERRHASQVPLKMQSNRALMPRAACIVFSYPEKSRQKLHHVDQNRKCATEAVTCVVVDKKGEGKAGHCR